MSENVKVAACPECNVALIAKERRRKVSLQGIVGTVLVIVGVISLLFNVIVGAVLTILGILVGAIGNKVTVMFCPQCGKEISTLKI